MTTGLEHAIDVDAIRAGMPAARATVFLNTGTFGPLPERATRLMLDVVERQGRDGRNGPAAVELWKESQVAAREALGRAVGAPADSIAVTHATTDGMNTVVSGLRLGQGDEIVTTSAEHPGLTQPLALAVLRHGVSVVVCEAGAGVEDRIVAAIGPRTRLIAISHVLWNTGQVLDLTPILAAAAAAEVRVLVDGAQAAGAIPLDVSALGVDYYGFPGQKWLCGPDGTGGLYVRPDRVDELVPSWGSYYTSDHGDEIDVFWPGARRFDVGTVTISALAGLGEAIAFRLEHDIAAGARYGAALAASARGRIGEIQGVTAYEPPGAPTPFVVWQLEGQDPKEASDALAADGVVVRFLPGPEGYLRACIAPWTTEGDIDRLVASLARLTRGRAG
jgi:L-cysteine/cystine lyase